MHLADKTLTVFNAQHDITTDSEVYTGTVISGVSWFETLKSNVGSSGLESAKVLTVRIPVTANFSGKSFADFIAYKTSDPSKFFTLRAGDIIVKGAVQTSGLRPADLKNAYSDMFTIVSVTDDTEAPNAPHWKVVGA